MNNRLTDYYVSLWVGYSESDEKLLDYISVDYEDEDNCYSQFEKDFEIDDFDEDSVERLFLDEKTDSLKKLLSGCSYEDKVIPEFEKIFVAGKNFNCGILVYEMDYDGNINFIENKHCQLEFVGTVKIRIKL